MDFSDAAIRQARALSAEVGVPARFLEANVYDLPQRLDERFDVVYTAVGVLCWLPDLAAWAQVAARFVKPGGVFYIMDVHPFLGVFEAANAEGGAAPFENLRVRYPYFAHREALYFAGGAPSYAGDETIESGCYEWPHSVGEILSAIAEAGLALEFFHEFDANRYQAFPGMVADGDGWWRFPGKSRGPGGRSLPQLFSLRARKPA